MFDEVRQRARDFLAQRSRQYRLCFGTPSGNAVLHDLAKFCRAHESTFNDDPRHHAMLEGRREVWLRIQQHLGLTAEELLVLHPLKQIKQPILQEQENEDG